MTRGAELGALVSVERLQEGLAVRTGCEIDQQVVRPAQDRVVAGRQIVQRRILDDELALTHRAADVDDGVA